MDIAYLFFSGYNQSRKEGLLRCIEFLTNLGKKHEIQSIKLPQFIMLVDEIVKNIFDHAGGIGLAIFEVRPDHSIWFLIFDAGKETYDLNQIRAQGSTLVDTERGRQNHNLGLGVAGGLIQRLAEGIGINLQINTSQGFVYSGVWKYSS